MIVVKDEYKGSPTLVIKTTDEDKWPFSFGSAKAIKLLSAIAEKGLPTMLDMLVEIAGDKLDATTKKQIENLK